VKLPLTITTAGLQALIDAESGTTNAVTVAALALSSSPFVMAPTLTGLPGEFKRISAIAGESVSETVIHMVATDDAAESYTVTGFGLFLDTGDLFGVFSQTAEQGPLFEKSEAATFLFAVDITFEAGFAAVIQFGDANFTYPPATLGRKGVAFLASSAEVAAGVDAEKIVTPATLGANFVPLAQKGVANGVATLGANGKVPPSQLGAVDSIDTFTVASQAAMLALATAGPGDFARRTDELKTYVLTAAPPSTLANWQEFLSPGAPVRSVNGEIGDVVLDAADVGAAPAGRNINTGGLAQGGGSLAADRTISVAIASAAETLAGLINDKAVTPASLASVLTTLAGMVPQSRHVDTGGLATGGGDLTVDRTITVPKANGADVEGMTNDTKAVTAAALAATLRSMASSGYLRIPGTPLILQWGSGSHSISHGTKVIAFPVAFPSGCWQVLTQLYSDPDGGDESDEVCVVSSMSAASFNLYITGDSRPFTFGFLAIGI